MGQTVRTLREAIERLNSQHHDCRRVNLHILGKVNHRLGYRSAEGGRKGFGTSRFPFSCDGTNAAQLREWAFMCGGLPDVTNQAFQPNQQKGRRFQGILPQVPLIECVEPASGVSQQTLHESTGPNPETTRLCRARCQSEVDSTPSDRGPLSPMGSTSHGVAWACQSL